MSREEFLGAAGQVLLLTVAVIAASLLLTSLLIVQFDLGNARMQYVVATLMPVIFTPLVALPLIVTMQRMRRMKAAMERLAHTDHLTGLPNRRAALGAADAIFAGAAPDRPVPGVLMIDVDHFKAINDRYGHETGDRALRAVAEALRRAVAAEAPGAILGRLGGEEFVVVVPRGENGLLRRLGECICAAIRAAGIEGPEGRFGVTVSVGMALPAEGADFRAALRAADGAVYEAKRMGRDRAFLAGTGGSPPRPAGEQLALPLKAA